ncbi:MAG: ABC transporter ATP-binding protein [Thermoplasmata archaeon]
MTEDAIWASQLTKTYGPLTAVDHVDLRVPEGGIFGLLGPNGAGKTTIIKLLTGLSEISGGEARVAGFDVRRDPMEVKQRIGWVAAEVILDDDFSAWENLWLQARLQRLTDWPERADELLTYFSLEGRKKDKVGTFSTGMRKKLEIALALLHKPKVIFMDEPTIGLDPGTRRMLWELITGVNREYGITIFLTSHYIEEADALCHQVAILNRGRIVALGTPNDLKSRVHADFLEIDTREPLDEARLKALAGVQQVRTQGTTWILKVSAAEEVLPRLFAAVDPGQIRRINVEKPSLESVFIDLTGQRIDEAGGEVHDFRKFYANVRRARG